MNEEVIIVATVFLSVVVVFIAWFYLKFRSGAETHQTIRLALEKGTELSPEFIKQIVEQQPPKDRDLRRGIIWLALGLGMILLAVGINEPDAMGPLMGSASFPALIGLAYIIMWRYGARQ